MSWSSRWAVAAACAAASGAFAVLAAVVELTSGRDLPPGWTRYQPPWTIPALVAGIGLLIVALGLGVVAFITRPRS